MPIFDLISFSFYFFFFFFFFNFEYFEPSYVVFVFLFFSVIYFLSFFSFFPIFRSTINIYTRLFHLSNVFFFIHFFPFIRVSPLPMTMNFSLTISIVLSFVVCRKFPFHQNRVQIFHMPVDDIPSLLFFFFVFFLPVYGIRKKWYIRI